MTDIRGQNALVDLRPGGRSAAHRRLPQHSTSSILIPMSLAMDLAEGRSLGHAQRVAYIAMSLADAITLDADSQLSACYAALMHDVGVVTVAAEVARGTRGDERLVFASLPLLLPEEALAGLGETNPFLVDRIAEHTLSGSRAVRDLELPDEVAHAIATHHERWDGNGYPDGLVRGETPVLGRIIGIADQVEALVEQTSPLLARRNLSFWLAGLAGHEADPEVVSAMTELAARDSFWLGLFSADLVGELTSRCVQLREPKGSRLLPLAEGFARLVDSRFEFTENISSRVARYSESLGKAIGLSELRLKQLRVAALLHDVGHLSMSERILSKPGILSVEELGSLQLHPIYSRDVVAGIPGMEDVAEWVVSHHERIDGRGYPEGRTGDDIPLESRILAVADAYVAITSDRPHRPSVAGEEARDRLVSAAGTQLDAELVDLFLGKLVAR